MIYDIHLIAFHIQFFPHIFYNTQSKERNKRSLRCMELSEMLRGYSWIIGRNWLIVVDHGVRFPENRNIIFSAKGSIFPENCGMSGMGMIGEHVVTVSVVRSVLYEFNNVEVFLRLCKCCQFKRQLGPFI